MSSFRAQLACLVALTFALATGCGGGGSEKYPPGGTLLQQAATATRAVTSLAFSLRTSGDPQVKAKSADAKLLRGGNAQGSVQITELGLPIQLDFVVLGKTVHLKGLTGGWQQQPLSRVAGIYDPSAVLDPDRGLVQLLTTAKNPSTKGRQKVAGQDCYRVDATLAQAPLSRLVPGVSADTPAELWIAKADHRVLKADVKVPSKNGGKPGTATVTFADFNKPFSITAPAQ
ncbi:LppX_LprAFG lipoprotein [Actinoallomurus purpureus]|uniref:LppX_LprAFG lipoprotein n=1 Tax=Actinoallomurus purpureus TaxID=478114 RepID=UPI002093F996|nr:LppX_LprAFG lipoprotein [Actinoallomurus purpureus]MCO6003360.1 LppX_LprAFG lipoprotein [Actinoallomurus purpureus]